MASLLKQRQHPSAQGPESWYPICLSDELPEGVVYPFELFETEWILFRGNGNLGAVERYCAHMGTDLANGRVVGACLECPLHRWRFDSAGNCTSGPRGRGQSALSRLLVTERYGIIFVYWGVIPAFELPIFNEFQSCRHARPVRLSLATPYLSVTLNAFDLAHLAVVHDRIAEGDPVFTSTSPSHLGITFSLRVHPRRWQDRLLIFLGISRSTVQYDCFGGNMIMIQNREAGFFALLMLQPLKNNTASFAYLAVVQDIGEGGVARKLRLRAWLTIQRAFAAHFLRQDVRVIAGMRPKRGSLTEGQDAAVKRFWEYWEHLPIYVMRRSES